MKKFILVLLSLAMLGSVLFALAACSPKEETFELTKDLLSSYYVVMPESHSNELDTLVNNFRSDIAEVTGKMPEYNDDNIIEGNDLFKEQEYEILVGKVNRNEVKESYKNVKTRDHGYALVGKKILIFGYTDAMIKSSISDFKKDILANAGDGALLRSGNNKTVNGSYDFDTITLNGTSINKYKIVYPSKSTSADEKTYAARLNDWISEKTGYTLDVVVDTKSEKSDFEFNIGYTDRITDEMLAAGGDGSYTVYGKDGLIWLYGKDSQLTRCAVFDFCSKLDSSGVIDINSAKTEAPKETKLSVMSYNIYYDLKDTDRDPQGVLTSIEERMPDVFDTVETTKGWFELLEGKFKGTYTCVKGKAFEPQASDSLYNAIFFKTSKFSLIESGTKWFSNTPNTASKLDNSPHYKGMTYAVLKEKSTGATFVYVAVHTSAGETRTEVKYNGPNGDGSNARKCREEQIKILKELLEKFSLYPIIIGGDFNAKYDSKAIKSLITGTRYVNTTTITENVIYTLPEGETHPTLCRVKKLGEDGNTVPPFTEINPSANQIDYFFVTKDSITVQKFEEWDNKVDGKYPSDHIPVCAELTILSH